MMEIVYDHDAEKSSAIDAAFIYMAAKVRSMNEVTHQQIVGGGIEPPREAFHESSALFEAVLLTYGYRVERVAPVIV